MKKEGQIRIPSGCAIAAVISKEGNRMSGEMITNSMKPMHDRSNGLGGGFAAYGIYPDYKDFSDSKVTPGITVSVTPMKGLSFWASAVEGFRAPVLDELYYSVDLGMPWLPGGVVDANPDLKPEKSWNYEVGMNALFG